MPRLNASNNFSTTLAQNITDTDTSFDVTDASDAPATPFVMTIRTGDPANGEIIEVGSVSSNTFSSVSRGQEGTTAQSWSSEQEIARNFTAKDLLDMQDLLIGIISVTDYGKNEGKIMKINTLAIYEEDGGILQTSTKT